MIKREHIKTGKRIFWIAFFFLLAAIIISAVEKRKGRIAKDILVEINGFADGNNLISREDVLVTIERSFGYSLAGIPVGGIDVGRVERVLENDPFILAADIFIDARSQIHIEVTQRVPILRVIDQNGLTYYLDEFGKKMPTSKHFTARVLVATGKIPPYDRDYLTQEKHVLKDLYELTNKIREDEFLNPMIEQIDRVTNGDYRLIPKVGDQKIILGSMEDVDEKLNYLKVFYKEAIPYKGWQKFKTINLKFKGQVVAGKR